MMLSDLDGFLTGIAVGPELVLPSEWLPLIWRGEAPEFADEAEAKAILGAIMARYNEILRQIADNDLDPVFWVDRDGTLIAADWAEGFLQAIMLRADAWGRLFKSKRDSHLLFPILALCADENRESLLGLASDEEERVMEEMTESIPACVRHRRLLARTGIEASLDAAHGRWRLSAQPNFAQNRPQPALSLRLGQQVQKVLRPMSGSTNITRSLWSSPDDYTGPLLQIISREGSHWTVTGSEHRSDPGCPKLSRLILAMTIKEVCRQLTKLRLILVSFRKNSRLIAHWPIDMQSRIVP